MEKKTLYVFIFVLIVGIMGVLNLNLKVIGNAVLNIKTCNDGTTYGTCSVNKEFYCDNGNLISDCNSCGCGDGFKCLNSKCAQADYCEQGNGVCSNECDSGNIEYLPLTNTCNVEENNNGNIDISNSKEIIIRSHIKNTNLYRVLENINVNALVKDTTIKDGYTLLVLYPGQEYNQSIILKIPDSLDKSKAYLLHTQVLYSDKSLNQEYGLSVSGSGFSLVIKNFTFSNNQRLKLGDDMIANFEIINKKCCIKNQNKIDRFYGYCIIEEQCFKNKPLICRNGILIEDCSECGCDENYNCAADGKCALKVSSEEIIKFYENNNIDKNEQAIVGNFIRELSRIPRSPEKPNVTIEDNKLKIIIEDIKIYGLLKEDNKPQINIDLNE